MNIVLFIEYIYYSSNNRIIDSNVSLYNLPIISLLSADSNFFLKYSIDQSICQKLL